MQVHHDEDAANRIGPEFMRGCPNWARTDLCGLRLASALKSAVCDDGRGKA